MSFINECKKILESKEKSKHKQSGELLFKQIEDVKKTATNIRDKIKQLYKREEYVVNSEGEKVVHFFEPFPNLGLAQGRKMLIDEEDFTYKQIVEITDNEVFLTEELKKLLCNDSIIVSGPYIIHPFYYYQIDQYTDWNDCYYIPVITSADIKNKPKSWKKRGSTNYLGFHDWKPKFGSFKDQIYESSVYLIAVEITMVIK